VTGVHWPPLLAALCVVTFVRARHRAIALMATTARALLGDQPTLQPALTLSSRARVQGGSDIHAVWHCRADD